MLDSAYKKCINHLENSTNISLNADNTMLLYEGIENLLRIIGQYESLDEQLSACVYVITWIRDLICNKSGIVIEGN